MVATIDSSSAMRSPMRFAILYAYVSLLCMRAPVFTLFNNCLRVNPNWARHGGDTLCTLLVQL
jgi:hypothetical protein